ncbi:MAG: WecB/TagA/CpsF family glycosyltransferase [Proteobacteria bacterium]|nr:WecB/TagA/CpsF family glycosyltransferase [Pseudomonadota bacterium]
MKQQLFGCAFDAVDLDGAVARVADYLAGDELRQGCGVNVDHLVKMDRDRRFADAVEACDLVTADGTPVVWASRLLRRPLPVRVAAIDLFEALLPVAVREGWPIFLLGAREDVVADAAVAMRDAHPGLRIVGARDGYFTEAEEPDVAAQIAGSGARLLFVGITSPKKEEFVTRQRDALGDVRFVLGVGGSFDIAAGRVKRAPKWMARAGLEWTYRLAQEPRRLWRRYLVDDVRFVRLVARELTASDQSDSSRST